MLKRNIGTAVHCLRPGTPGPVAISWNRSALAAQIAAAALALGLGPDLTVEQMEGLARVVRDDNGQRQLSAQTQQAIRAALEEPLTSQHDPRAFTETLFSRIPGAPLPIQGPDGRRYALLALPM